MIDAPFALAFTAGLVATVNPCGFAMLPAYLGWFLGLGEDGPAAGRGDAVRRALTVGAVVSSGFLVVFGVTGVLVTVGLRSVIDLIPWAAMAVGLGLLGLGVVMLAGREPTFSLPHAGAAGGSRGTGALFGFGVSYAVASLSCTLPIFLAVVAGAIPQASLAGGILLFVVYGVGMSLVLVVVTLAVALGRQGLVRRLRRASAHVNRVSGAILVLAGGYIVWFWSTSLSDPLAPAGPVALVERWSSRATELIGARPVVWGVGLGAVVVVALASLVWTRRRQEG